MREIKFKVLDKKGNCIIIDIFDFIESQILDIIKILQYTGLKDINNKEIYEGDIVEIYDAELDEKYIAKIEYDKDCFVAKTNDGYIYSIWNIRKDIKIIGNI